MKKKMLLEAQKRLGILLDMGLKDEITKVFDERSLSELVGENPLMGIEGVNMTFEDVEDLQSIKELFEEQYDCLVYYSILTETATMGQMVSFFYVSRNEEEWEDDVRELREGFPFVYVWNRDLGIGEFGSIQFEMVEGAVVRIA